MKRLRSVVVALALTAISTSGIAAAKSPDIVLITVDTLRADHLPIYGYQRNTAPNITRWFSSGTVLENAYATMGSTAQSITSILSGLYPQEHGVRVLYQIVPPDVKTIGDYLPAHARYQRAAFVSSLCLTAEAAGINRYFDVYNDYVDSKEPYREAFERHAEATTDAVLRWLEMSRDRKRPLFLWVHYIDPHGPYHPPADWKLTFTHKEPKIVSIDKIPDYEREPGVNDALDYVDRYDEEIRYLDSQVGRLLDYYTGRLDNSLVLFTADHGESMTEHEMWFTHQYHVYNEIVRVPLLMRGVGIRKMRNKATASGIDVAPTIIAAVGAPVPHQMKGIDLRKAAGDPARVVFTEDGFNAPAEWRAAISANRKVMVRGEVGADGTPRYVEKRSYDLSADPSESRPVPFDAASDHLMTLILQQAGADRGPLGIPQNVARGVIRTTPKIDPRADPETLKKLKSLGYVNP